MDGWMDGWMDGRTYGRTDGRMDGWMQFYDPSKSVSDISSHRLREIVKSCVEMGLSLR